MLSLMKNKNFRYVLIYLSITVLSLLTCSIYYIFSHGEQDSHMTFLFLPSAIITIIFLLFLLIKYEMNKYTYYFLNSAFSFLWVYMLLSGIYLIAKVESLWRPWFLLISILIYTFAFAFEIVVKVNKQ